MTLRIGIIGTGAMACFFAGRLHARADVVLVGSWAAQIEAIRRDGLLVTELDGTTTRHWLRVSAEPAAHHPVDLALCLVKSYQTPVAAARAAALLGPTAPVITLQNGIGNLEQLAAVVGADRATAGTTAVGATLVAPGVLRHAGPGVTWLARPPAHAAVIDALADRLTHAGLDVRCVADATGLIWGKAAVNAAINPLTALLGVPNGFLADDPDARRVLVAAAREAQAVAQALGITLPYDDAATAAMAVARATADNRSSMLQDVQRGAPTEIDAICGAIGRAGAAAGVATPLNDRLLALVQAREAGHAPETTLLPLPDGALDLTHWLKQGQR